MTLSEKEATAAHPSGAWALVLTTSCVLAFAYACWDIHDFDIWWHLNAGQWSVWGARPACWS